MNQNVNKDTQNQNKTSKPAQSQQSQDNQQYRGSQMGSDQTPQDRDRLRNRINPSQQGDE